MSWEYFSSEATLKPNSPAAKEYYRLCKAYSKPDGSLGSWQDFPHIGCECGFRPFKKGPIMVVEMKNDSGEWTALVAEHMPDELRDAVYGARLKNAIALNNAAASLTAQEVYDIMPIGFPMTHE